MTLLTHDEIKARSLFSEPAPDKLRMKATSVDLTIGMIVGSDGRADSKGYTLKPSEMVQVISAERFSLPDTVTALVSYKTTMTRQGIWALTVGLVDPGWDGCISTTLLNFSKVDVRLHLGQEFLRASFFEHSVVPPRKLRKSQSKVDYVNGIVAGATTVFPTKFLDRDDIASSAGEAAAQIMKNGAFKWAALIALIFAVMQLFVSVTPSLVLGWTNTLVSKSDVRVEQLESKNQRLEQDVDLLKSDLRRLRQSLWLE